MVHSLWGFLPRRVERGRFLTISLEQRRTLAAESSGACGCSHGDCRLCADPLRGCRAGSGGFAEVATRRRETGTERRPLEGSRGPQMVRKPNARKRLDAISCERVRPLSGPFSEWVAVLQATSSARTTLTAASSGRRLRAAAERVIVSRTHSWIPNALWSPRLGTSAAGIRRLCDLRREPVRQRQPLRCLRGVFALCHRARHRGRFMVFAGSGRQRGRLRI